MFVSMRYAYDDFPINKGQITFKLGVIFVKDVTLEILLTQCNLGLTTLVTRRMTFCPPPWVFLFEERS
jgi:hypothetical protein